MWSADSATAMRDLVDSWRDVAARELGHFVSSLGGQPVSWWFDLQNASTRDFMKALASDPMLVVPGHPAESGLLTVYLEPSRSMGRRLANDRHMIEKWIADGAPLPPASFTWVKTCAPESTRWDDVWMHDKDIGWAVNAEGNILKTTDGFKTYDVQSTLKDGYMRCIAFADDSVGWLGTSMWNTREQLLHTQDGGKHWSKVDTLPGGTPPLICGLSVVDRDIVFAVGTNYPHVKCALLKTSNGGEEWEAIDMTGHAAILVDVYFKNANEGWVVGGEDSVKHPGRRPTRADCVASILHTTDGGKTWRNVLEPLRDSLPLPRGEWAWKIQILDDLTMLVSLENFTDGAILRSDDGGKEWRRLKINDHQRNSNLQGIGFIDKARGWVGGWYTPGRLGQFTSVTTDGGENWANAGGVLTGVNRFRFVGNVGYASGKAIYKFTDEPACEDPPLAEAVSATTLISGSRKVGIKFKVAASARKLKIRIWDVFGMHTRLLLDESNPSPGDRIVEWDFVDDDGSLTTEREFIVRITTDNVSVSAGIVRKPERF